MKKTYYYIAFYSIRQIGFVSSTNPETYTGFRNCKTKRKVYYRIPKFIFKIMSN